MLTYLGRYEVIHSFALMAISDNGAVVMEPGDNFCVLTLDEDGIDATVFDVKSVEGLTSYALCLWNVYAVVEGETIIQHVKEVK